MVILKEYCFAFLCAIGSINAGFGATGMNVFLTSLNIPWLSKSTYKIHKEEAKQGIDKVAAETSERAVREEVEALMDSAHHTE